MLDPVFITEPEVKDSSFDLESLKKQGLQKIQELSGNKWTDFNFHDPGVTILEILCYALSDLAYRADFDVEDIFNTTGKRKLNNTLFPPGKILTTAPISVHDFKRMMLDIEGLKNCSILPSQIEKVIPGIFDIRLKIHPDYDNPEYKTGIIDRVNDLVNKYRPPGIMFEAVDFLENDPVGISVDIELSEDVEPKKIFADFIQKVQDYFSPEVRFSGLQELIDKGLGVEDIFNGPLLENGFLTEAELMAHEPRQKVFVSDLMSLAMAIPGVSFVRELKLNIAGNKEINWIYDVRPGAVPRIDPLNTSFTCRYRNTVVFENKKNAVALWSTAKLNRSTAHKQNTINVAPGIPRNLKKFHSIQFDFPETYGIGAKGPSHGSDPEKLAAIKQFKGYLMIFDQVMANFLAQLDHVKYLFSTEDIENSYAVQLIDDIPGMEYLYKQFIENYIVLHSDLKDKTKLKIEWNLFLKYYRDKLTMQLQEMNESAEEFLQRRNAILDHLLARFGVDTYKLELLSGMTTRQAIAHKLDLLRNFPLFSSEKYVTGPSSLNPEISGIKCWLAKNLDLGGAQQKEITTGIVENLRGQGNVDLKIEVHNRENPLDDLLKNALDPSKIKEESNEELLVLDGNRDLLARIYFGGEAAASQNKKEVLLKKLVDVNRASENFILVDHLALRPGTDLPVFGFDMVLDERSFFISERNFNLADAEQFLAEFHDQYLDEKNYRVEESGHKEFRIKFNSKRGALITRSYYSSAKEANQQLEYFLHKFSAMAPVSVFTTKYEDVYSNLGNPFSHIVTVILPTWPGKFQDPGFKKYMEEYFYSELPAHLAVNLKWKNFTGMQEFEKHWQQFDEISSTGDIRERVSFLDRLMTLLAA